MVSESRGGWRPQPNHGVQATAYTTASAARPLPAAPDAERSASMERSRHDQCVLWVQDIQGTEVRRPL